MARRARAFKLFLPIGIFTVAAVLAHALWLPWLGDLLIHDDGPAKADIAVVLAGDTSGSRILKAADLVRQGYVPAALISGAGIYYGLAECDVAIPFAVRHGFPAQWFIPFPNPSSLSTRDEVTAILAELRRRGVHSFLLVTSDLHTARASRIFRSAERAAGGGPEFRAVAAPDPFFHPGSWWNTRESQKSFLQEWCKTVTAPLGI